MIQGLGPAISALRAFAKKLGNAANNVANVSTQGFKKSRLSSQEVASQNVSTLSSPSQIGSGTTLGEISEDFSQGFLEPMSSSTDMAVAGDVFFMVNSSEGETYYTRDGEFYLNKNGRLMSTSGEVVQGWALDPMTGDVQSVIQDIILPSLTSDDGYGAGNLESVIVNKDGVITGHYSNGRDVNLFQVTIAQFHNPQGLKKIGNNLYAKTNASGDAITGQPGTNGLGRITPNALEQSNVDVGTEVVNIILIKRGFQANLNVISTENKMIGDVLNIIS